MATWAVGDIHGCHSTLERLLSRLDFDEVADSFWLVGDLVNRGPRSLDTLRWARRTSLELGERFVVVLGNHDLHLVAVYRGWSRARERDTLDEILAAGDVDELVEWLATRPILHRQGSRILVHAGLLPEWSVTDAETRAREVEEDLADSERGRRLLLREGRGADTSDPGWRALGAMTRLRGLREDGSFCDFSGAPEDLPADCAPWFGIGSRRTADRTIVCGHWAAMGLRLDEKLVALDSGAAWGGPLTAVRIEDRKVVQEANRDLPPVF